VLLIDNYDSFTYNLVHLLEELGAEVVVRRNDAVALDEAASLEPDRLVVSPGPGRPADAGVSVALIRELGPRVGTLGVCLGHQAVVEAFGGEVGQLPGREQPRAVIRQAERRTIRLPWPSRSNRRFPR
jgi:anthranilate synthase component 2